MAETANGRVTCGNCKRSYRWTTEYAARKIRCKCGATMTMPGKAPVENTVVFAKAPAEGAAPAKAKAAAPAIKVVSVAPGAAAPMAAKVAKAAPAAVAPVAAAADDESYDLNLDDAAPAVSAPVASAPAAKKASGKAGGGVSLERPSEDAELSLDLPEDNGADLEVPAAATAAASTTCPSCKAAVKAEAVICMGCGFNLKEGKSLTTQTGGVVRATTGPRGKPRHNVYAGDPGGFFERFRRGWEFAKISYGILWDFKQLVLFPVLSASAALLVMVSFLAPLWGTGTLQQWSEMMDAEGHRQTHPLMYVVAFAFYFCSYFVIAFFNTALVACAMKVTAGEVPTLKYGLGVAIKRLPQIAAWALLSAVVGLLLKVIENAHDKVGKLIAAIFGSAWTVLTFFVVPVLAVEGVGPFKAVKRSVSVLSETWGESLVSNSAMGIFAFLLFLPILVLMVLGFYLAATLGGILPIMLIGTGVVLLILHAAASSAADGVCKALLYNYATGASLPADVDEDVFAAAFAGRPVVAD